MPKLAPDRNPRHRRHASGQGVVTLSGRDHYTGAWGTPESDRKYLELVGRWNANGRRRLPDATPAVVTVKDVMDDFEEHAAGYYIKRGEPTAYGLAVARVCARVRELYGSEPAASFGRREFELVRESWIRGVNRYGRTNCRATVNHYASIVRAAFRRAVGRDLAPWAPWLDARIVPGLPRNRTKAPERKKIMPVSREHVEATMPHLKPAVADMVRLQLLTGMRPGEVRGIRGDAVDRTSDVWLYKVPPEINKTEHRDRDRIVAIGPKGAAILGPYLDRSESPGKPAFTARARRPYSAEGYASAIRYACKRHGVPHWHPNQLRHTWATEMRAKFGAESTRVGLGHANLSTTEIYAEQDIGVAVRMARESG